MSRMSNHKRIKIGCVITDGRSSVLGVGFNRAKSHPIQAKYNKLTGRLAPKEHIHAEIDAVNNLIDIPSTATAYIGRLDCNGNQAMCKPCVACTQALKDAGVTVICYTNTEGKVVKHGL